MRRRGEIWLDDAEPLRIGVPASAALTRDSDLLIDQLRAIDNRHPVKGPLTELDDSLMGQVERAAMREVLNLIDNTR